MDKSLLFLILSLTCFYVVMDEIYGKKLISKFLVGIVPSLEK